MRVYAKKAFRYLGVDYPFGWQDLSQSLADTLQALNKVGFSDNALDPGTSITQINTPTDLTSGIGQLPNGDLYSTNGFAVKNINTKPLLVTDIANCQLWLDASSGGIMRDATWGAYAAGDAVVSWPDRSGLGQTVTPTGSPVLSSINGLPAVKFSGAEKFTVASLLKTANIGTTGFTMFVVATRTTGDTSNRLVVSSTGLGNPGVWISADRSANTTSISASGITAFNPTADRGTMDGVYLYGLNNSSLGTFGINTVLGCDGTAASSSCLDIKALATGSLTVGTDVGGLSVGGDAGYFHTGNIGEVIFYNRYLTYAEINAVQGWLMSKWGFDKKSVVCCGDSLTTGTNSTGGDGQSIVTGTTNYPNKLKGMLGGESSVSVRTDAYPGRTMSLNLTKIAISRLHQTLYNKYSKYSQYLVLWQGTNDVAGGPSGTVTGGDAFTQYMKICADASNLGFSIIPVTIMKRQTEATLPGFDAQRVIFNNLLRSSIYAKQLVDLDLIPQTMNTSDTTYFAADKIHGTDTLYQLISAAVAPKII
jgi:lysophospholipase L1-like esterase